MALGDSISAGAFSRGIQSNALLSFGEWRGESYAGGADPGAITVPNLIKRYKPTVSGGSIGMNPIPELCFGPLCPIGPFGWNASVDQLNAAQSGALASNLYHEVVDYLIPQVKKKGIPKTAFKYLNLQIGSNDICSLCAQADVGIGPGSPDDFEANIRKTLEAVRKGIPNTVVNLFGAFRVSDVFKVTANQPYCSQLLSVPFNNLECPCMLIGGAIGDANRVRMDKLQVQYNERLIKIAKDYQTAQRADFAVLWQPANVPLLSYPVESLSNVDCFHPSLKTHRLVASHIWNKLPGGAAEKEEALVWSENPLFRCLQDDDRMKTNTLL
jgi:phospholipase B1